MYFKKFWLNALSFLCFIPSVALAHADNISIIQTPFEPDLCQKGYAGSWTGACVCYEKINHPNRYCDPSIKQKEIHPFVQTENKTFTLSGAILNWDEATLFCNELVEGFRLATRQDFKCEKTGISCLDATIFLAIKKQYKNRGFFWLEKTEDGKNAYYVDLNDGTVYNTKKSNATTMQALCIKEDLK